MVEYAVLKYILLERWMLSSCRRLLYFEYHNSFGLRSKLYSTLITSLPGTQNNLRAANTMLVQPFLK